MVGTNKDEMAFFFLERKATELFTLTEDGLKSQLQKDFGANAEKIMTTYRKSRPDASPSDLYVAITTARAMWLGSIEIAEKKYQQKAAPVYMYMFVHESNFVVPGTNHRIGAPHASEIVYKFDNVDAKPPGAAESIASVNGRRGPRQRKNRAEHERNVGHVCQDRASGRQGATHLACLHD